MCRRRHASKGVDVIQDIDGNEMVNRPVGAVLKPPRPVSLFELLLVFGDLRYVLVFWNWAARDATTARLFPKRDKADSIVHRQFWRTGLTGFD
ncbi:hypothetical protein BC938DRAFT_472788 [Jimgerdemannia flammicorona]|uniref:Uncharacterized protein n=1 Tax=Jimgerdemannia flammicorona TaxID=994334 RepID=A0A433Q5D8_9FUNG|nr:hypothetical protein BC938DRAFT_472788 [Jimgerdemannia flammicorona]